MSDTIAAIATGSQLAAIGVIRLSGPDSIAIVDRVFTPASGGPMAQRPDRLLVYGALHDAAGGTLDLCLCTVSRAPHSYTGEDTAELQCHGSPAALRLALEALYTCGARAAAPGEFTKRAFLNGRMDLAQAEAVIDLIGAETEAAAKNAAAQLGGAVSRRIAAVYNALVDMASHFHAVIDYPDEEIEPFALRNYTAMLETAERDLGALLESFSRGRVLRGGVPTAILGRPNAGKSSLLNALLGYDRAIVTDIPGTTRDTITETVTVGGVLLRLTDTAGLRDTQDAVERLGVQRSREAAAQAELALVLLDPTQADPRADAAVLEAAQSAKHIIAAFTKSDILPMAGQIISTGGLHIDSLISISSVTPGGLRDLEDAVRDLYPIADIPAGEILTNARQADAVSRALTAVRAAYAALLGGLTPDAVLTEAEGAMSALGELTGRTVREDVTAGIFARFCVGK